MAQTITLKKGASLTYIGQVFDGITPKDITTITLTSQIRNAANELIDYFDIVKTDAANGEYEATPHAGTANYPVGKLKFDIKLVDSFDNTIVYTETGVLNVLQSITA